MDTNELLKKPLNAGIAGFIIGLLLGWLVIGWGLWPVEWTNASPGDLRADAREDYLRMAIDTYTATLNKDEALRRWNELGAEGPVALDTILQNPGTQSEAAIQAFRVAVSAEAGVAAEEDDGGSRWGNLLMGFCLVGLLIILVVAAYFLLGRRGGGEATPAMQAAEVSRQAEKTDYSTSEDPPLTQFMTTYMLGDDLFDDSFSVDSPSGEFLGECGVGIAETIGAGEPKRVTGYEVWLFDKNDIQTVTKVLMSASAFNDSATKERLAAKGEPVLAEPGAQFVLETATLQMVARVVDMAFGSDGALPEDSFFDRMTLELALWTKS